jgi:hypothetical protein
MLHDLDRAMADIASRKALKQGSVRVAAPQMLSCNGAGSDRRYRTQHKEVQVRLTDCPLEQVGTRVQWRGGFRHRPGARRRRN